MTRFDSRISRSCSCNIGASLLVALPLALLLALGCSDRKSTELASVHVASQDLGPAGGTLEVPANVQGPGASELIGTKVVIPPGALDKPTKISIDIVPGTPAVIQGRAHAVGPAVELGPDGAHFAAPVTVTLPYQGDIHAKRLRVFAHESNGTRTLIGGSDLTLDADPSKKLISFKISHFTQFQNGEMDPDPCDNAECGPPLTIPNWMCEDGTVGGPTGVCERQDDGSCAWGVNWCPMPCGPMDCGPIPTVHLMCPSGEVANPVCRRLASGDCGWDIQCHNPCDPAMGMPVDPTMGHPMCPSDCRHGAPCPMGAICDPMTGRCIPQHVPCGDHVCGAGEYCCNESCGICAPLGAACTTMACTHCGMGMSCPPHSHCDPMTGRCVPDGEACADHVCGSGEYCCNVSCGICAPVGAPCTLMECHRCTDPAGNPCPPGSQCDMTGHCIPTCGPMDCGPAPGIPSWTCEDGSPGGFTGHCIPSTDPMTMGRHPCAWEINWCPRRCEQMECGPVPGMPFHCSDGSLGGPTGLCFRFPDGSCHWEVRHCP